MNKNIKIVAALMAIGLVSPMAYATNGMLMEGYGPIATGMGGASMAYDNGTAGMANNPATLGLMADGNRLDLAVGILQPEITSKYTGAPDAKSSGTSYLMPAAGWVKKQNGLAYGVGVFAQGGMGTDYKSTDWVGAGSGKSSRSEVGVGSLIVPVSFDVTPDLTVAGSVDFVWSSMDLQMAMGRDQMFGLYSGGLISASGAGAAALPGFFNNTTTGAPSSTNVGYFNFSDDSAFTGAAKGNGYAGKLGATYKVSKALTLGATYHSKTAISDMTANSAQMVMIDNAGTMGGPAGTQYTLNGKMTVKNFQFPETYGFGAAYQATNDLMVAADWKHIGWKDAMKSFKMHFSSAEMGGLEMDLAMPQNWEDQDVIELGVAYQTTKELILRVGANIASNPVPDSTVNPLFPATVKSSYTLGAGYAFNKVSSVNASLVYVPVSSVTSPNGYSIDHSQMNWQFMYSHSL